MRFSSIITISTTFKFIVSSGIVHMTQNTLNGAKFYELRRAPQNTKIRESFEVKVSGNVTPTVICTSEKIGLALNENFGDVRIFASDRSQNPECSRRFSLEFEPEFVTPLDGPCGVRRVYKGVPSTSVDYSLRLIVSYNPLELTEYDRIYDVTCSLQLKTMEVRAAYDIIEPATSTLASKPSKPAPKCKYSLHHGAVQGPKTVSAHVGETIFHRWKCASPTKTDGTPQNVFVFKVYACVVHDEHNRTYTIIDEDGCSLDEEIIPTPEYDVAHGLIYTPSKAFRFANSNHVHFKCMISVCSGSEPSCRMSVPPKCKRQHKKRREVAPEMTIEQRLWRIRDLMRQKANVTVEVGGAKAAEIVEAQPLKVEVKDYELLKYQHVLRTYQIWTWILCAINVFLVVLCVLVTFRLLKNKYVMDIKDTSNTVFRRVPF